MPGARARSSIFKACARRKVQGSPCNDKDGNPFPAVCGRVCNKRCELACTRGDIDSPVSIDAVKKFVADLEIKSGNRYVPEKVVQSVYGKFDEKIAIIGGGPAGLSAAYI